MDAMNRSSSYRLAASAAVSLAFGLAACAQPQPELAPSPPTALDTATIRLDAPAGQVSKYREVADVLRLGDRAGPGWFMILYTTRKVVSAAGDTDVVVTTVDSSALTTGGLQRVSRYTDYVITTHLEPDGRTPTTRLTAQMYTVPSLLMSMIRLAAQRPALVVPRRPVRVGETWDDSIVTRYVGTVRYQGEAVRLRFRLKALREGDSGRIAVVAARGLAQMADTTGAPCGPLQVDEEMRVDITARRIVGWKYTMQADCRVRGTIEVGQSYAGELQP